MTVPGSAAHLRTMNPPEATKNEPVALADLIHRLHGEGIASASLLAEAIERDYIAARVAAAKNETLAPVIALADQYDRQATAEGYGGELWSTTAAAIQQACGHPAGSPAPQR